MLWGWQSQNMAKSIDVIARPCTFDLQISPSRQPLAALRAQFTMMGTLAGMVRCHVLTFT